MKMRFGIAVLIVLVAAAVSPALELVRQKNVATYITFPIVDADGDLVTGAAGLDSEIDAFADGSAPDGFADCTNEATEIGSTGWYYLSLSQAEMNGDYIVIQTKTSTPGAKSQGILIRTQVGDPLLAATTDDGGAINVAAGVAEADIKQVNGTAVDEALATTETLDDIIAANESIVAIAADVAALESRLSAIRAGYLDALAATEMPATLTATLAAAEAMQTQVGVAGAGLTAIGDTRLDNLNSVITTTTVFDGNLTLADLADKILAILVGKAVRNDLGATSTWTFYKQDGTTPAVITTSSDSDGSRAAGSVFE